jgi:hypothetical protein
VSGKVTNLSGPAFTAVFADSGAWVALRFGFDQDFVRAGFAPYR